MSQFFASEGYIDLSENYDDLINEDEVEYCYNQVLFALDSLKRVLQKHNITDYKLYIDPLVNEINSLNKNKGDYNGSSL